MNIQLLEHSDLNLITDLIPPGWESALPAIEFYTTSDFCFPIQVKIDNKIAGIGTAIIHNDVAWLAHIIVHPDHRNQGIGRFITQALLETAKAKYCNTIYLLATELGEPVYSKVGFEPETEYLFFKGEIQSDASLLSEHIVAYTNDFKEQILLLDRQVSGEDRMFHLEQHLSNGFVYLQEGKVLGYYLPALGDGLIIASANSAGLELMKLRLSTMDFAIFPKDNVASIAWMQQHNFQQVRRQKRMRFGRPRNWEPSMIYNRIGGNLG